MKRNLIILLLIITSKVAFGQSLEWFTRNSIGNELTLRMNRGALKNIYPIRGGKVVLGIDTVDLYEDFPNMNHEVPPLYNEHLSLYYLYLNGYDSNYLVELEFYDDWLVNILIYAKGHRSINNLKIEMTKRFPAKNLINNYSYGQPDSTVHYGNKIVSYRMKYDGLRMVYSNKKMDVTYDENLHNESAILIISDKRVKKYMPIFCSQPDKWRTWKNVEKELKRNADQQ